MWECGDEGKICVVVHHEEMNHISHPEMNHIFVLCKDWGIGVEWFCSKKLVLAEAIDCGCGVRLEGRDVG